jgi:hypothetical protein
MSWVVSVFIFVGFAASKLASYIFPLFPALAILLGFYLNAVLEKEEGSEKISSFRICLNIMSLVFLSLGISLIFAGPKYIPFSGVHSAVYMGGGLCLLLGFAIFVLCRREKYIKTLSAFVFFPVIIFVFGFLMKDKLEQDVSCKEIMAYFQEVETGHKPIMASKILVRAVRFYTDQDDLRVIDIGGKGFWSPHPVDYFDTDDKVLDFLNKNHEVYAVVRSRAQEDIERITRNRPFVLEELYHKGGKVLIRITRKDNQS